MGMLYPPEFLKSVRISSPGGEKMWSRHKRWIKGEQYYCSGAIIQARRYSTIAGASELLIAASTTSPLSIGGRGEMAERL